MCFVFVCVNITLVWFEVGKSFHPDKVRVLIKHSGGVVLGVELE